MNIPFLSLKALNQKYESNFKEILDEFLQRGSYMLSKNVTEFENNFAKYCQAKHCIGVANGLDALELILQCYEFPKDSEVIVPANTYYASILSVLNVGLKPVLVEPNPDNFLIDPHTIEKAITPKTVAVMAVNLYGKMCDFNELSKICTQFNLKLFVDAAQSHGAIYKGTRDCPGADAIAYSFYPTKNLGALSDAGAVVTNHDDVAENIRKRRNYGSSVRYQFEYTGKNSRLSELQAGFLNIKLSGLEDEIQQRRAIAVRYLSEITNPNIVLPPADSPECDSWHLFVIKTENRENLSEYLKQNGIGFDIHYPKPPHRQKALQSFSYLSLPITEKIHETVLSIPLNPDLSEAEVTYIINTLNKY